MPLFSGLEPKLPRVFVLFILFHILSAIFHLFYCEITAEVEQVSQADELRDVIYSNFGSAIKDGEDFIGAELNEFCLVTRICW